MKKVLIIILLCISLCGCIKKETKEENKKEEKKETKEEVKEQIPVYQDLNTTPISIYKLNSNSLTKLSRINTTLRNEDDIGLFQVFPSNEDQISLTNSFSEEYHNKWLSYKQLSPIKLGFNISFTTTSNEKISYNILSPTNTMDKWEYLYTYLYGDYVNRNKSFYSHIENDEYNEDTIFTAIKLQSGYKCTEIDSKILLTVFTYDTEDDFLNNEYRGNSKYTLSICLNETC